MISRLLGRGEAENAGKIGTFVIWSSAIVTLLYSLVIFGFGRQAVSVLDGCSRRDSDGTESGSCQHRPGSGQGENGKYRNVGGRSSQCVSGSAIYIRVSHKCGGRRLQPVFPTVLCCV